jgi:hypothetical protein
MRRVQAKSFFMRRGIICPMRFQKLRIAWSVTCGIAAVLLIVFWVRSYTWLEGARIPMSTTCGFQLGTLSGLFAVGLRNVPGERFMIERRQVAEWRKLHRSPSQLWGGIIMRQSDNVVYLPIWFLAVLSAVLSAVPWVRQRGWSFSLRSLLVATTLIAVMLGLIVWAAK